MHMAVYPRAEFGYVYGPGCRIWLCALGLSAEFGYVLHWLCAMGCSTEFAMGYGVESVTRVQNHTASFKSLPHPL